MKLSRDPTPAENKAAHQVCHDLLDALAGVPARTAIAGAGTFIISMFIAAVKPEYRLAAFDEWAAFIRKNLEKGTTNAHH
jgi:hypothetical protein